LIKKEKYRTPLRQNLLRLSTAAIKTFGVKIKKIDCAGVDLLNPIAQVLSLHCIKRSEVLSDARTN
jgi:hypothetical protein